MSTSHFMIELYVVSGCFMGGPSQSHSKLWFIASCGRFNEPTAQNGQCKTAHRTVACRSSQPRLLNAQGLMHTWVTHRQCVIGHS